MIFISRDLGEFEILKSIDRGFFSLHLLFNMSVESALIVTIA